jgi:hypothetical protein
MRRSGRFGSKGTWKIGSVGVRQRGSPSHRELIARGAAT